MMIQFAAWSSQEAHKTRSRCKIWEQTSGRGPSSYCRCKRVPLKYNPVQGDAVAQRRQHGRIVPALVAGAIQGTDAEKRFFYTFRVAAEHGFVGHILNVSSFWAGFVPRLSLHNDAVKHAAVALGATYHYFRVIREETSPGSRTVPINSFRASYDGQLDKLERMIVGYYSQAMLKLQECISAAGPDSVIVAITCCLIFVSLENLRLNQDAAVAHLTKGAEIVKRTFDISKLFNLRGKTCTTKSYPQGFISTDELKDLIMCFRHIETVQRLFKFDLPLSVTSQLCSTSRLDSDLALSWSFSSLKEAHQAVLDFSNDAIGYEFQISGKRGDTEFWSLAAVQARHDRLRRRAAALLEGYRAFLSSAAAPEQGTRESVSCYQDIVCTMGVQGIINMMPVGVSAQHHGTETVVEMLHFIELLLSERRAFASKSRSPLDYTTESAAIASLYYVCVYTSDVRLQERALRLLSECTEREGPWDGKAVARAIAASKRGEQGLCSSDALVRWADTTDCHKSLGSFGYGDDGLG